MRQWRSLRVGLTAVFLLFLILIALLGAFAIRELRAVNDVSGEIRDRWLQSTRVLGDLNNYTSDARAAEASRLLARNAAQTATVDAAISDLDRSIDNSEHAYQAIRHDSGEQALYRQFAADWVAYRRIEAQVLALSRQGRDPWAAALYMAGSLQAYNRASDALGVLTDQTVRRASLASDQAQATYRSARSVIVIVIVIAGLSLVGAVNYITRFISGPLLVLAARMRSLAANDTSIEIEGAERQDEIGEMARAMVVFRGNAIELAHSQRGLVQQAVMLEERLEAEQKLTTLQRSFVSMASHEFRTPLTIIDGQAQRLAAHKDVAAADDIAERAGRIRSAVRHLIHVIDRLLNSARLFDGEAGLYFHPTRFEPRALLHEVCQQHRDMLAGDQIEEHLHDLSGTMVGDPKLLYQVFSNLLSNAIKYSPDGTQVELTAVDDADHLVVTVEDYGLGIPETDLAQIFERYHRGGNVAGIVGTGVGLYLVKMVVDLHGGQIVVDSREGQGSRFVVRLPVGAVQRKSAESTNGRPSGEANER